MPLAIPSGYDPNSLLPFIGLAIRLGVGAQASSGYRPLMLLGNRIEADITRTVSSVTYTTTAGTASAAVPVFVPTPADADLLFGAGSELARDCRAVFDQFPTATVYATPVAENGSAVKATATILYAGTITAAGVDRLTVNGLSIPEVSVATTATGTSRAAAVATAVNQQTGWPVTATVSTGTLTLTAKQGGTRGNNIAFEAECTATGGTTALNGGSAVTKGQALLASGAGADDVTNALAAFATDEYFLSAAHDDATNWTAIRTSINSQAGLSTLIREQAVVAFTNVSVGTAVTRAQAQNGMRLQIAYQRRTSAGGTIDPMLRSSGEIAASLAAARLYGDGFNPAGTVRGELAYPAANLNNCMLSNVTANRISSGAALSKTEQQQLLFAGVTPLVPSARNPGFAQIVRSVTSYSLDGSSNPTNAVRDTSHVTVTDYAAKRIEARITADYPNKNIGDEPANPGQAPSHADVIFPSMVRTSIVDEMNAMGTEGLLVKNAVNTARVQVEPSPTDNTLLIGAIPASVIPQFRAFVGTLSEV